MPGLDILRLLVDGMYDSVESSNCETILKFVVLAVQLGSGDNLSSADRRCEEPLLIEGGSLIGSKLVVVRTGHGAAG